MEVIDTHCHVIPSGWKRWCEQYGWDKPDGMPGIPVSAATGNQSRYISTDRLELECRSPYCAHGQDEHL